MGLQVGRLGDGATPLPHAERLFDLAAALQRGEPGPGASPHRSGDRLYRPGGSLSVASLEGLPDRPADPRQGHGLRRYRYSPHSWGQRAGAHLAGPFRGANQLRLGPGAHDCNVWDPGVHSPPHPGTAAAAVEAEGRTAAAAQSPALRLDHGRGRRGGLFSCSYPRSSFTARFRWSGTSPRITATVMGRTARLRPVWPPRPTARPSTTGCWRDR